MAGLTEGCDGNFYGTTYSGGTSEYGTVFRMTTNGVITTLASFAGTNGTYPVKDLTAGADGNLYGVTSSGGSGSDGTVFRVKTNGVVATVASFSGTNGATPWARLISGNDGNLYGTTDEGGSGNDGTVFRMTTNGVLTTLVSFNNTNGANPCGLTPGSDGNFYGTTDGGGSGNDGTVFRMTTNGVLTTLVSFNNTNGASPGDLTLANDCNFYGTTDKGGDLTLNSGSGYGTVFRVTTNGALTTLFTFNNTNGAFPYDLTQGKDGTLYGMAGAGGNLGLTNPLSAMIADSGDGTVFQVTTNGVLTTLALFNGTNGAYPMAFTLGNNGALYGVAECGGSNDEGVIFELLGSIGISGQPADKIAMAGSNATFSVAAYGASSLAYQWFFYGTNLSGATNSWLTVSNVSPANQGIYQVIVTNTYGAVTSTVASLTMASGPSWNLRGDWNGSNPNGAWNYGGSDPHQNTDATQAYGILPGYISLQADNPGMSYAVWTSPIAGVIEVSGAFGHLPYSDSYGAGDNYCDRWIYQNSTQIWHVYDGYNVDSFDFRLVVKMGDTLKFQVGCIAPAYRGNVQTEVNILGSTNLVAPVIATQPNSVTNMAGNTVLFTVVASSQMPLYYQWQFNGTNIADDNRLSGSQSPQFSISNLQTGDAGSYAVVVTNLYGSALSTPAILVVSATLPQFQSVTVANNTINFSCSAVAGLRYQVQYTTNLAPSDWTDLGDVVLATNSTLMVTGAVNGSSQRFYRVKIP